MRLLRILLFGVLALLALLVGGPAGFWWLGGPEAHRWVAHWALEAILDREVQVDGTLEIELGTVPALYLTDLRIDNPSWAAAPALLRVERAEIQIVLRSLLRRALVFPRLALDGVSVDLETAADGRHSWKSNGSRRSAPPQESFAFPLFESLEVGNATITYHDQRDGQRTQLHLTGLTEQRDASGDMRLDVAGEINGNAFQIKGRSGSLEAALAATDPYPVAFDLQLPAITATVQGTIADAIGVEGLNLHLEAQSPSLRTAAQAWNLSLPADAQVEGSAKLTGDLAHPSLTDLVAEMTNPAGDRLELSGGLGDVWDGSGLDAAVTLKLQPEGGFSELLPADWPDGLDRLEASTRLHGSILAPVFEQLSVDLQGPGDSRLQLDGTVGLAIAGSAALDHLDMTAALAVPQPSAWAEMLGVDVSVLGALRGEARLTLADQQLEATDLTIDAPDFGALQLEARGVVGTLAANHAFHLAPDISFTAQMADSGPVLALTDTKVPELGALAVTGRVVGDDRGYRLDELELDLGEASKVALIAAGSVGPLVTDDVGAAELDLMVRFAGPSSTLLGPCLDRDLPELGMAQGSFGLHGTVADLRIEDAELETKRDDGVVIVATGGIEHLGTVQPPQIDGVAFDLEAQTPSTTMAAQLFGHDVPDFGPVHARARLGQSGDVFALSSIDIRAGSADAPIIQMTGAIGDLLAFEKVELAGTFEIPTADLLALVDIHGKADLGTLQGEIDLSDGDGSIGIEHLEAKVEETDLLALEMDGLIDDLEAFDQVELETSLEVSNIANLAEIFGVDADGIGQFRFDGHLSEEGRQFGADGTAVLGETRLVGKLAGDFTGPRPSFKGRLHAPHLRLADLGLIPADQQKESEITGSKPYLFGPEPLPLEHLQTFDLDLEIQLDDLEGIALAVDQAKAHVTLTDGALKLSPLRFDIVGGVAEADLEVDVRDPTPRWRLHAATDDVQLGDVWRQLETEVPLTGELDLVLDLQATGRSPRDLASSLDGDLSLALQRGEIASRLFGLTTMSPLRWLTARSTRRGYSEINCFVAGFHAEKGVAELDALVLDTPDVIAAGEGKIDFSRETLDLRISPEAKQSRLVELATPFAIRGDLANPTVATSTTGATARLLGRVAAGPVNLLGSLLPFVNDRGSDTDNPCLKLSDPAAPKS